MSKKVTIKAKTGEVYTFDPETNEIEKNGIVLPKSIAEPIYSSGSSSKMPNFCGICLTGSHIVSLQGNISRIEDEEEVS